MSNLIDIQTQIEKLQKQANEIKAKEFNGTVQDILAKMQAFGITLKDLRR
jgi:DNA-binding protein H-NS